MGNQNFMSTGARIFIQLDNTTNSNSSVEQRNQSNTINDGSIIRGKVYLEVLKDSITADILNIRFYGQEITRVEYQETITTSTSTSRNIDEFAIDSSHSSVNNNYNNDGSINLEVDNTNQIRKQNITSK
jgi:hypothetical protein